MKKDKKFLLELEKELNGISKKKRNTILLKYENLIKKELANKKTITKILNSLGSVSDIAKSEIESLKENRISKKIWKFITRERNLLKKEKKSKKKKNRTRKIKIEVIREYDINDSPKVKNQIIDTKQVIEIEKEIKKEKKLKNNKVKENKNKTIKKKKLKNNSIKIKNFFTKINIFKKINFNSLNIFKKVNFSELNIFKKINFSKILKRKKIESKKIKKPKIVSENMVSEETVDNEEIDNKEYISILPLTRSQFVLRILGIILITMLFIIWCFSCILFIASVFAYLDGVKIFGLNLSLFGLVILILTITLSLCRMIFRKKNHYLFNIILIIISIIMIAVGIVLIINSIKSLTRVHDVSEKYSMTSKIEINNLPSNGSIMNVIFNSEYDIQYIVKYDDNLDNKFKMEIKYYEEYYDYYIKKSSNDIYVSLSPDFRDRLSVYIDDFKENKVFDNNELKRYIVKITINKKDYSRLIIQD